MAGTIRAVLFDLDGTLHDRAETVRRYLAGHVQRFVLPAGYAERWAELDDLGYRPKHEVFALLVQEFDLTHDPEGLLADWYAHSKLGPQLMPGTREVLAELRTRGMRLGLVSNGRREGQRATLAGLGLEDAFDTVLISEEVGFGKPDPRIYALALEQLGLPPEAVLFVGDSPVNDVAGPQAAGMRAALFPGGHLLSSHIRPDWRLSDLRGVLALLAAHP